LFDQSLQLTFASVTAIVAMAFPMIEKIRAIGNWRPNAETPVPPDCSKNIKTFCETLYWSERNWRREIARSVWEAKLFKTHYAEKLENLNLQKPARYIFEMTLVSAVVQVWMLPFMVVYFHRISFAAIFLNIGAGMLVALESLAALTSVAVAQLSEILALPFIKLTEILNRILLGFGSFITDNSWSNMRLPHYSGNLKSIYVLYFLPVFALTFLIYQWKPFALKTKKTKQESLKQNYIICRLSGGAYLTLLALIIFHPFSAPIPDGRLHVDFLDVGQGDSLLVTMPTGETLLVDGGGKPVFNTLYVKRADEEPEPFEPDTQGIGETVVSAYLWDRGYDKVDYILATHADTDHIQGLSDVARNFKVQGAIFGRTPIQNAEYAALYRILQKRDIPIIKLSRGQIISFDEAKIEVLNPEQDENPQAESDNNHSLVLRVSYGNRNFLLTGDAEKEAENEMLRSPDFLRSDVVKVAHHGSKTSSTINFINAAQAKIAIISVGKESPFGHPKPEIVERWKSVNAKVLTTGENGTISISTDGRDLQLKTFVGKIIYR
ncbi:MAG: ComEC/Rec2 family competence protein, partial [Pyrinomonadaceae bacterium]